MQDELFGFEIPQTLHDVDSEILNPKNTWQDKAAYDEQYGQLAEMFIKNFEKFATNALGKKYKHMAQSLMSWHKKFIFEALKLAPYQL